MLINRLIRGNSDLHECPGLNRYVGIRNAMTC